MKSSFDSLAGVDRLKDNLLVLHIRTFATSLMQDGYSNSTLHSKLGLVTNLGQWLERGRLPAKDLDETLVDAFAGDRRAARRGDPKTLKQFLQHLRDRQVIPGRKVVSEISPLADTLNRYEKYLRSERGLATSTVVYYQDFVRKFLVERFKEGPLLSMEIRSSDVSAFILRHARTMAPRRAQLMTTAFRSFFRFLFRNGELPADLAASVPAVADWRQSSVPKHLSRKEVACVLAACDRETSTGRRDYAILLLLARLGLRAGEVVALQLDDLDWRAGEILIRGKGLVHDRLPLPADVGKALTVFLRRDRPRCKTRRVFLCMKAPRQGFSGPSTLTTIVRRAIERAGLHPAFKGAHLLRHSLATSMLRSGATMNEIGQVLRHRAANTTEIYAKVDFDSLRTLALPWPTGGGQ